MGSDQKRPWRRPPSGLDSPGGSDRTVRSRARPRKRLRIESPDRSTTEDPVEKAGRWRCHHKRGGDSGRQPSDIPSVATGADERGLNGNRREPVSKGGRRNEDLVCRDNPNLHGTGTRHPGRLFLRGLLLHRNALEARLTTWWQHRLFRLRVAGGRCKSAAADRVTDQHAEE